MRTVQENAQVSSHDLIIKFWLVRSHEKDQHDYRCHSCSKTFWRSWGGFRGFVVSESWGGHWRKVKPSLNHWSTTGWYFYSCIDVHMCWWSGSRIMASAWNAKRCVTLVVSFLMLSRVGWCPLLGMSGMLRVSGCVEFFIFPVVWIYYHWKSYNLEPRLRIDKSSIYDVLLDKHPTRKIIWVSSCSIRVTRRNYPRVLYDFQDHPVIWTSISVVLTNHWLMISIASFLMHEIMPPCDGKKWKSKTSFQNPRDGQHPI